MLHNNLSVNAEGHLTIGGADAVLLAENYGTALYVIDEDKVRENCRKYVKAMKKHLGPDAAPLYASKALSFKMIYSVAAEEKMCADVVSAGEIHTALRGGFPASKMYFHGNNKTDFDIAYALDSGVGCFIIDNYEELDALDRMAGERGIRQDALLRLTPGIDPHTFEQVNTGKIDCQFGVPIETGQAEEFTAAALERKNINLLGYHCHIGSQIFDAAPFCDAIDIMLDFTALIRAKYGYTAATLNLGGGFGVRYVETDPVMDIEGCIESIGAKLREACAQRELPVPRVLMEPGRSIVADAGVTLYTVGSVKNIDGFKNYVSVDGGMSDNPRYALYGSPYTVALANRAAEEANFRCTVCGRCCESGALIQENVLLPKPRRGDILAVFTTGAYNYSMASNYNRICRPALVMLSGGDGKIAVRRETFADLLSCDI